MSVEFQLVREQPQGKPNVAIFHLAGWLDAQSEGQLVEAVRKAKDEGIDFVLLDLASLDTITSAGIRGLQQSHLILSPKGSPKKPEHLRLCNVPPQIYQVLKMTGMLLSIPAYESADIAVDSFGA
jgi:anti-anti-sigma factor